MFRRSGSFVCFFVEGPGPEALSDSFLEALAQHRFRSIENAAAEQTSVGWVTRRDPTGDSFGREDMDCDAAVWMRMRIDKKSAPTKWLRVHLQAADQSAGKKLNNKERKELKEDLLSRLLPRVLPTIGLIDALYFPERRMVMLFGTSNAITEAFRSLFYKTFSVSLRSADPYRLAMSIDLDSTCQRALDSVTPIEWSTNRKSGQRLQTAPVQPAETKELEEGNTE